MLQKQSKSKLSKEQLERLKAKQLAFKNADDFIRNVQLQMEPISLGRIVGQESSLAVNGEVGFLDGNLRYFDERPLEYVLDAGMMKKVKSLKNERIEYEKNRVLRLPVDNKVIDENLNALNERYRLNQETRELTLTENSFKPTKYLQNVNLPDYKHFVVQSFGEWIQIQAKMTEIINQIKKFRPDKKKKVGFLESFLQRFGKQEHGESLEAVQYDRKIEDVVESAFFLSQTWYYNDKFPFRVICIHKKPEIEYGNFILYMREYPSNMKNPQEPLTLQTAQSLKARLLFAYSAAKNKQKASELSQAYLDNTKANIGNHFILKKLEQTYVEPPKQLKLTQNSKLIKEYKQESVQNFMDQWKRKAFLQFKNSKLYFYIQPMFIHIPKTHFAREINLITNNSINQAFNYSGQNEKSFIFASRTRRTHSFLLSDLRSRDFQFVANIKDDGGRIDAFGNKINLAEVQNEGLGFSYELGLIHENVNFINNTFQGDFPYVLVFEAAVKRAASFQIPEDLKMYREVNLLTKVGKIPNIYSSYYKYDYTPEIHPLVSQILNGSPSQVNQKNFEETYLQFVNFFQHEENKSQNYCEYLRLKKVRQTESSGFVMRERYSKYCQYMSEELERVRKGYPEIFSGYANIDKRTIKREISNLSEDLKGQQLVNAAKIHHMLQRYIIYQCLKNREHQKIGSHVSMVGIADKIITLYQRSEHNLNKSGLDINELSIFFIAFMESVYPYNNYKSLQEDLMHLRLLTQRYLPQFNYLLNRKGIGLENFASTHLLEMFTSLPAELCYRIWDLMVNNFPRAQQTRIFCLFTLMLYQEKSSLLPIYPINQMIDSIKLNSLRFKTDDPGYYNMSKLLESYSGPIVQRQRKIVQLAKHKYLRKFVYGMVETNVAQDEEDFPRATEQVNKESKERIHTKLMSLRQVKYPLPSPGFQGYEIQKIYLFVSGIFLLNNLNIHSKKFELQINAVGGSEIATIEITDKSSFENRFIQFDFSKENRGVNSKPIIQFRFYEKNPTRLLMSSRLRLNAYHKDVLYRENVTLNKVKTGEQFQLNNLGTSVINVGLIIKSCNNVTQELNRIQEEDKKNTGYLEKFLDYDLSSENNEIVKAMSKLDKKFRMIMDPLDQLDIEKYLQLKVSTSFLPKVSNWIKNSQVTIEQLKAIFGFVFSEESEKSIRLNFPKFYENYASNYQKFDLGKFLLQLILMSEMPKSKKLSMLFCIGVHYQGNHNSSQSQEMSVQTLNSLIHEIMRSTGFLNACPFTNRYMGEILYACYYEKGSKVEENRCEITEILQDWAYICQLKSQYGGIILGSVEDLSVLRAMIPENILTRMEREELCRFEVHYRIKEEVYIWSATVNTSDFSINKRGVKFLNTYPKYYEGNELLTSVAEVMLNSENIIPLQNNSTLDYQQFIHIFKSSPLLDYLLRYNEQFTSTAGSQDKTHYYLYEIQRYHQASDTLQVQPRAVVPQFKDEMYTDFALFRYQNCMPRWRSCKVIEDEGKARALVEFKNKQGSYLVPRFEIICLDEVEVSNKMYAGSEISESQFSARGSLKR